MTSTLEDLAAELVKRGRAAGLTEVGIAGAEPFDDVRVEIERRRDAGLHGGMQFTFRNPARSTDPGRIVPGARSLIVGAQHTPAPRLADVGSGHMRIAAYARHDHYSTLRSSLEELADRLRVDGWTARVVADDNALVDRAAAVRAGIGWWGRNANVLIPGWGSWFVLGSVVTDAPLPASEVVADGCGSCRRCLDGCPTGAVLEDGVVDARRCLAWLVQAPGPIPREFRVVLGGRLYGCDDCQEVCPVGRPTRGVSGTVDPAADVAAVDVLGADDQTLLDHYGHWYVAERDPRYLRRNALVALGNTGRADDEDLRRVLAEYLVHADSLLRAHAVWAVGRLGCIELLTGHPDAGPDGDPTVAEELALVGGRVGP